MLSGLKKAVSYRLSVSEIFFNDQLFSVFKTKRCHELSFTLVARIEHTFTQFNKNRKDQRQINRPKMASTQVSSDK